MFSYFQSEWSFAQFKVTDKKTKVGFLNDKPNTLIVTSTDGKLYDIGFDPVKGGECVLRHEYDLTKEGK